MASRISDLHRDLNTAVAGLNNVRALGLQASKFFTEDSKAIPVHLRTQKDAMQTVSGHGVGDMLQNQSPHNFILNH
jgi:hypothetical protein